MTSTRSWTLAVLTAALLLGCPRTEAPVSHPRPKAPAARPAVELTQRPGRFCFSHRSSTLETTLTLTLLPSGEVTGMAHETTLHALEEERVDDAFLFRGKLSGELLTVSGRSTREGASRDRSGTWAWKGSSLVLDAVPLSAVPCPPGS